MNQQNPSGADLSEGGFYLVNWATNPLEVPGSITLELPEGMYALVPNPETIFDAQSMLPIPMSMQPSDNSPAEYDFNAMMPFQNEATSLTMLHGFNNEGGQNYVMVPTVQSEETAIQEHTMDLNEATGLVQTNSGVEQIDREPQAQYLVATGSVNRMALYETMVQGEATAQEGSMDVNQGTGSVQMELSSGMDQAPQQAQNEVPAGSVKRRHLYEMDLSEAKNDKERRRIKKAKNSKAYNERIKREAERFENLDPTVMRRLGAFSDEVIELFAKMNAQEDKAEQDRVWNEEIAPKATEFEQLKNKLFPPDQ